MEATLTGTDGALLTFLNADLMVGFIGVEGFADDTGATNDTLGTADIGGGVIPTVA